MLFNYSVKNFMLFRNKRKFLNKKILSVIAIIMISVVSISSSIVYPIQIACIYKGIDPIKISIQRPHENVQNFQSKIQELLSNSEVFH